jgi:hypothetical protein
MNNPIRNLFTLALLLVAVLSIGCASSPDSHSRTPLADAQKIETLVDDVQARNTLHPDLWQEGKLDPLVRERLLKMAELFLLDTGFGNLDVKEIVFAGSMAGYLYHSQSDIDVHVSVDGSPITTDLKLLFQLFNARSDDWNGDYELRVRDHEVELFILDYRSPEGSDGVYSLREDRWIKEPKPPTNIVGRDVVLADVTRYAGEFESLRARFKANPQNFDCREFKLYRRALKDYRAKQGFQKSGEHSVGNLAYKALRNGGYLKAAKAEQGRCFALQYNVE